MAIIPWQQVIIVVVCEHELHFRFAGGTDWRAAFRSSRINRVFDVFMRISFRRESNRVYLVYDLHE